MSDAEQSSLLRDIKMVKRIYPVVVVILTGAIFLISTTHYFDSHIATTKDIEKVSDEIQGLRHDMIGIKASIDGHNVRDTTDKIIINNRLTVVERYIQRMVDRRLTQVIEHKNCPTCKPSYIQQ